MSQGDTLGSDANGTLQSFRNDAPWYPARPPDELFLNDFSFQLHLRIERRQIPTPSPGYPCLYPRETFLDAVWKTQELRFRFHSLVLGFIIINARKHPKTTEVFRDDRPATRKVHGRRSTATNSHHSARGTMHNSKTVRRGTLA